MGSSFTFEMQFFFTSITVSDDSAVVGVSMTNKTLSTGNWLTTFLHGVGKQSSHLVFEQNKDDCVF